MKSSALLLFSTRGSAVSEEHIDLLQDKAQKELVLVKQGLDEALSRERRAMHCGLVKKRRELISETVGMCVMCSSHRG